ncbi:hypothetical protein BU26DRAFT_569768 [Trematosphaeria pertusa]|uniref:Uncharacterized protein n=1 Tax=Trematosphaeria pertusa TaxID=390896 RepID=A0A6A6I1Y0_9PLEO|nr:uncharacterized protein BU26DRAFT_569768 [Trematosphaeria pertusa]KAF2243873.1 hypothetical protein BU26DRAFT_569768 [Trematosphaeria pertusa]
MAPREPVDLKMPADIEQTIKNLLTPEDWTAYHDSLATGIKGGPKSPKIRTRVENELREVIDRNRGIAHFHNAYVQLYNDEVPDKERFKLPAFPDFEKQEVDDPGVAGDVHTDAKDEHFITRDVEEETDAADGDEDDGASDSHEEAADADVATELALHSETEEAEIAQWDHPGPPTEFQGAQRNAYLHWLEYRGEPHPTASPFYSECKTIAEKIGRRSPQVHDEILNHWLLERNSERGRWYREHREDILGEEPRFDEATRRYWGGSLRNRQLWLSRPE